MCVVLVASIATAFGQNLVLVAVPPTYKAGESFDGTMVMPTGDALRFAQRADRGPGGQMYLFVTMLASNGSIVGKGIIDPRTWRFQSIIGHEKTTLVSTTCSVNGLFPLTIGKKYQCESHLRVNDRRIKSMTRFDIQSVVRGKNQAVTAICGEHVSEDDDMFAKSHACYTGDGKWIRELRFLEIVPRTAT